MKSTWAAILPKPIPPDEYKLVGEDQRDADEEAATTDWPLPAARAWAPSPQPAKNGKLTVVLGRIAEVFR